MTICHAGIHQHVFRHLTSGVTAQNFQLELSHDVYRLETLCSLSMGILTCYGNTTLASQIGRVIIGIESMIHHMDEVKQYLLSCAS